MTEPASITLMPDLPIAAVADEISAALLNHQVIVVAGETGSGKTTQLPKICLRAGRKRIGHTQPRRIAARSVAERLAEELNVELGSLVGYQVRFTRKAGRDTRIKVMTDGVLLAEIGRDPQLRRYDTIIIDEAHERSLNIDFLLGYLKQLLPQRPELKLIVTSATIDTARFSEHFGDAPVLEVTGRSYPVEVRYRPIRPDPTDPTGADPDDEDAQAHARAASVSSDRDQTEAIADAVQELLADTTGDILVFLSGEREIRDTADALTALELRNTQILPLYSRLSAAEQHRVFAPHTGRRIVLATNVAETSLTVPGIRSVIDPGTARISRYSARTKVQRLPIEAVSQASANQRAGRCGRVAPGVCIRLYSEADFASRPEFTEPEILRTNLASVILQMADAGLGAIVDFPFVEAPDSSQIVDGLRLLDELNALEASGANPTRTQNDNPKLTKVGRQLSKVPLDPRLARMLVAADDLGCLNEVSIIVAGLAIQDVRERPAEHREAADALHRRFWAPMPRETEDSSKAAEPTPDGSDFIALLRMWEYLKAQRRSLSGNAFRRLCKAEYLNFLRIREWQDLHTQLRDISRELSLQANSTPAPADRIHTAILAGLLSHVGLADTRDDDKPRGGRQPKRGRKPLREYLGARGAKFAISPGSSVVRSQPGLVMAGELVETTRLWARTAAAIEADQVEEVGAHLLKRRYSEPHWSARSGSVGAYETVSLYGVPIIAQRRVNYARIDPVAAREIFIRSALVEGGWHTRHHFYSRNVEMRAKAEELEERTRRRDIVVDDQAIFDFYAARIPADVVSVRHFDSWWRKQRPETPALLDLSLADLVQDSSDTDAGAEFPDTWTFGNADGPGALAPLAVDYVFSPGAGRDGVSVNVPVEALNQLDPAPFSWQVPGLRRELATELIRRLPKELRTNFVPAPNHAAAALRWLEEHPSAASESLPEALSRALLGLTGVPVPPQAWQPEGVDPHLSVTFVVTAGDTIVGQGKDLRALRAELAPALGASLAKATADLQVRGAKTWVFSEIDERIETPAVGTAGNVVGYPALVDEGTSVGLVVLDSAAAALRSHRLGVRRLLLLALPDPTNWVLGHLSNLDKLALTGSGYSGVPALLADARLAAVASLIGQPAERIRTESEFAALVLTARPELPTRMAAMVSLMAEIFRRKHELDLALVASARENPVRIDVGEQVANLVFDGFMGVTEYAWLQRIPSYLRAAALRFASPPSPAQRAGADTIAELEDEYARLCAKQPPGPLPAEVELIGWHLEELRIGLFAQTVGTRTPVSAKRVRKMIGQLS